MRAAAFCRGGCCFLAKSELVGGFKRGAADAADDGGAVSADEGIIDDVGTVGAPEACVLRFLRCGGVLRHSISERSKETVSSATVTRGSYTDRVTHHRHQRVLTALLAITVAMGLLLLLTSQAFVHGVNTAWFVFLPVLLFGLVSVPRSLWLPAETTLAIRRRLTDRPSLFQRPPPFA